MSNNPHDKIKILMADIERLCHERDERNKVIVAQGEEIRSLQSQLSMEQIRSANFAQQLENEKMVSAEAMKVVANLNAQIKNLKDEMDAYAVGKK